MTLADRLAQSVLDNAFLPRTRKVKVLPSFLKQVAETKVLCSRCGTHTGIDFVKVGGHFLPWCVNKNGGRHKKTPDSLPRCILHLVDTT